MVKIMKCKIISILMLSGCIYSSTVYSAHPQIVVNTDDKMTNYTLCLDNEDIYFNAQLDNGKYVSLCGYQHESPDSGYVKYRYGTLNNIELEFPNDKATPKGRFLSYNASIGKNVSGHWLFFYINSYRYSITTVAHNCIVTVRKGKDVLLRENCMKVSDLTVFGGLSSESLNYIVDRFPEQFQYPITD
ncbi:hypothetical protein [uncultured Vibrio sp.]|uniref:hypothetical protein n=1 Tax=uncultured Vibrio sp. TaxID=114054 RepID=UPI00260FF24D|nr:hypothetical protein [uncultured Vibrio sp.]